MEHCTALEGSRMESRLAVRGNSNVTKMVVCRREPAGWLLLVHRNCISLRGR